MPTPQQEEASLLGILLGVLIGFVCGAILMLSGLACLGMLNAAGS